MINFYSTKGGQGTTLMACATAVAAAKQGQDVLLLSPEGTDGFDAEQWLDTSGILGSPHGAETVSAGAGRILIPQAGLDALGKVQCNLAILNGARPHVVRDHGYDASNVLVTRADYLALRRTIGMDPPDYLVVVNEPGRALGARDCTEVVKPAIATFEVPWDPTIARCVDAGLLTARFPHLLTDTIMALRHLTERAYT